MLTNEPYCKVIPTILYLRLGIVPKVPTNLASSPSVLSSSSSVSWTREVAVTLAGQGS